MKSRWLNLLLYNCCLVKKGHCSDLVSQESKYAQDILILSPWEEFNYKNIAYYISHSATTESFMPVKNICFILYAPHL